VLPAIKPTRLSGNERLIISGKEGPATLDFWQWSSSDLLINSLRGIFAEYLVAWALGITGETRIEWDAADLKVRNAKIEINSAANLQTWKQEKLSAINFSIRKATAWDEQTGKFDSELKRQADLYVFCLLAHTDKSTVNPLDTNQWRFFVLPSTAINDQLKDQKAIGLSKLMNLTPTECTCDDLQEAIVSLVDQINVPTMTTENTRQDEAAEG
jgi:hypothetical protein